MQTIAQGNANGIVSAWYSSAENLLGWSAPEMLGNSFLELSIASQYHAAVKAALLKASRFPNEPCHLQTMGRCKNDADISLDLSLFKLPDNEICICAGRHADSDSVAILAYEKFRQLIVDSSKNALIVSDLNDRILFWSPGAELMFGPKIPAFQSPELPFPSAEIQRRLDKQDYWEGELKGMRLDGTTLWLFARCHIVRPMARILISLTDLGIQKNAGKQNPFTEKHDKQNLDMVFKHHPDGVFTFNLDYRLISVNSALSNITGYSRKELLPKQLKELVAEDSHKNLTSSVVEAIKGKPQTSEYTFIKKDGSLVDTSITLLPNIVDNLIVGVHGFVKDISRHKHNEQRILYLANHDPLTGLPNRNQLQNQIRYAIERASRVHLKMGIVFLDLDRFKVINDSLGHVIGDKLLCIVAERLKMAAREKDTVARFVGDEFVVLMEEIDDIGQIVRFAKNLLDSISEPIGLDDHLLQISTSIGASIFPDDGSDALTLLKHADQAMYAAKALTAGSFRFYSSDMNVKAIARLTHETELRHALEHNELIIHYQPRLNIKQNSIVGIEALVRWDHPQKGLIFPNNFITLAEETGMIVALGKWVLVTACRQMVTWRNNGLRPMKMAVNVSAIQLKSEHIYSTVSLALDESGLDPNYLELEITESNLMQNLEESHALLKRFRKLGISLSIDDFGTGYSSLNHLKHLPVDTLKIDKSFIKHIPGSEDDSAIVKATIAMAQSMHLKVVAEGVTSLDQLKFLEHHQCDQLQGYLFCHPLPAEEIEIFFKTCGIRGLQYAWMH